MRLIDADALILALETQDYSCAPDTLEDWTPMDMTKAEIADIRKAPTVDAVPVVRCKDCKYYHDGMFVNVPITTSFPLCFRLKNADKEPVGYAFPEDHFCAYGELDGEDK